MLLDEGIVGSNNLEHAGVVSYTGADAQVTSVEIRHLLDPEVIVQGAFEA